MKKTTKNTRRLDPVDHAMRLALGTEQVATMALAVLRMPTGTPALDAAQDAAMAATDRAMARLPRLADRSPR
jgi:hypothetical protein